MTMFALVSTVDTLGDKFPRGVMLFRTEGEAYEFAAEVIVTHDQHATKTEKGWRINWHTHCGTVDNFEEYFTAFSMVSAWQDSLAGDSEWFHVFNVLDLPCTVRELFLDRDHESFVRSIERMNQMYRLQVASVPTRKIVSCRTEGTATVEVAQPSRDRLVDFKKTLLDEINEIDLITKRETGLIVSSATITREQSIDILVDIADVLADIIVFCVSEMRKFGLPPAAILAIVMQSNMSKLQPDGSAKYDDNGKFLKGPNYFPPEPKIKELITELLEGHDPTK